MKKILFLSLTLLATHFSLHGGENEPKLSTQPVRLAWKIIRASSDVLNIESARKKLPKSIGWEQFPCSWELLPSKFSKEGAPLGPYKLTSQNDLKSTSFGIELSNLSERSAKITLNKNNSKNKIFEKEYFMNAEKSLAKITVPKGGFPLLEYTRVICGDRERFEVKLINSNGTENFLSDCTAVAALSPDGKLAFLESGIINTHLWEKQNFPENFPEFDQVVAWSQDNKKVALNGINQIIIVTLER
ncbi:MAG: hypothetical protein ACKVQC_07075 [Elusimicrobiota bacterium]